MKKLYPEEAVQNIADAIRVKNGLSTLYRIGEMASAIEEIPTGGGGDDNYLIAMGASVGSIYNSTVTSVMSYQFISHSNIKGIEMANVSVVDAHAFDGCTNLVSVSLPNCVILSQSAFSGCTELRDVFLPMWERTTSTGFIVGAQFAGCTALQSVNLPNLLVAPEGVFSGCTALTYISLPACTQVRSRAFMSCRNLGMISLPLCSYLSGSVFSGCLVLSQVFLLSTSVCRMINGNAFASTPMSVSSYLGYYGSIYVPSSLVDAYKSATNWSAYSDRIIAYVE